MPRNKPTAATTRPKKTSMLASKDHAGEQSSKAVGPVGSPPSVSEMLAGPVQAVPASGPGRASAGGQKVGVAVVGSLNMDLVVRTEIMPLPGQTVMGQDLAQNPGGKGGNQAAAAGRLWRGKGPGSKLIARIGEDVFGETILAALRQAKVDTHSVLVSKRTPTGTAMILLDRHGENAIVVSAGANRLLSATDLLAQRKTIESSVVLLAQLETPADTVACAFALAKRSGVLTILDPAPAPPEGLPESLYHVDILIPNQTEAQMLGAMAGGAVAGGIRTVDDARRVAERFLLRGTRIVIVKMGSQGAVIVYRDEAAAQQSAGGSGATVQSPALALHVPGFRVPVVDTTAAGDAFAGALAVGLAEGMALPDAVRFANAAGALACTKAGAMAAMPTRAEVERLLNEAGMLKRG